MKKTGKKVLAFLLCLVLFAGLLPAGVLAAEVLASGTCGAEGNDLTWTLDGDGVLTISGTGEMEDYYYYSFSGKYTPPWSSYSSSITSVVLETGVTSIGIEAFRECNSLTSVTIPESVTSIGRYAFYECTSLTSVTIPGSVTSVGIGAFTCSSLVEINVASDNQNYSSVDGVLFNSDRTSLIQYPGGKPENNYTIPGNVTSIGDEAFFECTSLTSVTIPDSVTSIGERVFYLCHSLKSVTIPYGVTSIGRYAFTYCTSLSSVTIPGSVTSIGSGAFDGCSSLTSVKIPNSVTSIGLYAFEWSGLTSVMIPDSVTSIGWRAFNCPSLVRINVASGNQNYSSVDGVLFNLDRTSLIQYPMGKLKETYTIPYSVTSIGDDAFYGCTSLTSVTIPKSATSIGDYAFYDCTSLTSVTVPVSVTSIGERAFSECVRLTIVTILNPECRFSQDVFEYSDDVTIYGYAGSTAEEYAEEYGFDFVPMGSTKHLCQLTPLDYLAFADTAYSVPFNTKSGTTIETILRQSKKWYGRWEAELGINYSDLYDGIKGWRLYRCEKCEESGFYAVAFENDDNEIVISFRGAENPLKSKLDEIYTDWVRTNLALAVNHDSSQVYQAIVFYNTIKENHPRDSIHLTGHSLGGGLAGIVSILTGSHAETWNSGPFLDIGLLYFPKEAALTFVGTDQWNYVDHLNPYDKIGGMDNERKPRNVHDCMKRKGIVANHNLSSFFVVNGHAELTDSVFIAASSRRWGTLFGKYDNVYMGTSSADRQYKAKRSVISYGGAGDDHLNGFIYKDAFVGGRGNDVLDGGDGADIYYYCNGHGFDRIYDSGGHNTIYLFDIDKSEIQFITEEQCVTILQAGMPIMELSGSDFTVIYEDGTSDTLERVGKPFHKRYTVACPVDVEIVDETGAVVFTVDGSIEDTYYTDYGYFYVYAQEDGELVKELELLEGYDVRIVGTGDGTMDITCRSITDGDLGDPIGLNGVPVADGMSGSVTEDDEQLSLLLDYDDDGQADQTLALEPQPLEIRASGEVCEELGWQMDEHDCLTVTGAGSLLCYEIGAFPWRDFAEEITEVVAGEGVTLLRPDTFRDMEAVRSVSVSATVADLSEIDWDDCRSLEQLTVLNADCVMPAGDVLPSGCVICGYDHSTAQEYAAEYGYDFVLLGEAHEHVWIECAPQAPVCATDGYVISECSCGAKKSLRLAAPGHDWDEPIYEWSEDYSEVSATHTCRTNGSHTETESAETVAAVINESTCTEEGWAEYTASFRNPAFAAQTQTGPMDKIDHTPGEAERENEVPATCAEAGSYDEVVCCSVCGEELSRETRRIAKTDHTPGEAERDDEVPATCSEEGSYDEVVCCSVCGEELSREEKTVAKLDHTPGEPERENEVPATTAAAGSYDEVVCCSVCGEELSRETKTIDKLPVTFAVTEVTVTPDPAAIGDTLTWTAAVSGGTGAIRYCFYVFKDGAVKERGSYGTANTYTYTPTETGTWTVRVYAKDSSGTVATLDKAGAVTVTATRPLTVSDARADKTAAAIGDTLTWTAAVSGGTAPYRYCFYVFRDGAVKERGSYGTANTYTYTPTETGTWTVRVYVKDASGTVATLDKAGAVTVSAALPLTVTKATPGKTSAAPGEAVTWTAVASGGTAPYRYCFYVFKDGAVKERGSYGAANTYTYTPTETGTWTVRVYVKDASGTVATLDKAGAVTVSAALPLTVSGAAPNTTSAHPGDPITWTASASGGTAPYRYCFYVFKDGAVKERGSYGTANTFTYTPTEAGTWTVRVYVKDASGTVATLDKAGAVAVASSAPLTLTGVTVSKPSAAVGETLTWTAVADGGSSAVRYCFYLFKDGKILERGSYGTAKTFSCKVTDSGTYTVRVYAKDGSAAALQVNGGQVIVGG